MADESKPADGGSDARADELALSPFCVHLQSKKLLFRTAPPATESDVLDASRHVWCRLTMQVFGPDSEIVSTDDCRAGRSCFKSIL